MEKKRCRMNLQFFADGGEGNTSSGEGDKTNGGNGEGETPSGQQSVQVDYEKIQKMLDGTLSAKEDTALKAYFKQQGLSRQEAEQAMAAFKTEKEKNQPDVGAMQNQVLQAQAMAVQANVEKEAMFMADELGVDLKTMPYLLKLSDISKVTDENGNINKDALKEALNKVLEELPQLKPSENEESHGFRQIGADGGSGTQSTGQNTKQNPATPTKRWNRWN